MSRCLAVVFALCLALVPVSALAMTSAPALARPPAQDPVPHVPSPEETAGLAVLVAELQRLVDSGDFAALVEVLPPRVLVTIADTFGLTVEETVQASRQAATELMGSVTLVEYRIDLDGARAFLTPDGSRAYVVLTLYMTMEANGIHVRAETPNIAFMDEGAWYIMDVSDPEQAAILRQSYPEFEGVVFAPTRFDVVEP